jgi:RimJ/RimL family protein N-acetyltransferase
MNAILELIVVVIAKLDLLLLFYRIALKQLDGRDFGKLSGKTNSHMKWWSILPIYQGRGFATLASRLTVEQARVLNTNEEIYAFPSPDNIPSNSICRKLGFSLIEECEIEYPSGKWMRANAWMLKLK